MEETAYVPLHVHSEYSILDGMIRVKELCDFAKEHNMPAVAITDHGVMYSALVLYVEAKEKGLKPLIGCEFYVHDNDIHDKNPQDNPLYHLILIAKNNDGYKNLLKLVSIAWCEGFYYHPRINWELLEQYHEGLICCSACLGGEVLKNLLKGDYDSAKACAKKYRDMFGEDYYIELQDHGLDEQKRTNPQLIQIAKELGIKMVITNDSHYLKKEDADAHDTLLCLNTKSTKDDPKRMRFPNNEFYVKTVSELRDAFKWLDSETFNECIKNTVEIADKCHVQIEMGKAPLPHYEVPQGFTTESYLEHLVYEGLKERYGDVTEDLKKRVDYELGVINQMGFAAYFLITWDFIHFAKTHGIPVGPGRGSAAGSVVAYSLQITDVDPIKYDLLFERFLNPERFTMPDIDIDFCIERRGEVIDYVTQKYGEDKVCQIITFSTYAAKAALKAVARVLNVPFADSNQLATLVEPCIDFALTQDDKAKTLGKAIKFQGSELRQLYDEDHQLAEDSEGNPIGVKKLVDMAVAIEGIKCGTGTHAAGIIISHAPLNTLIPIQPSKDGIVQTGYPPHEVTEVLSLLKMDFLGLRNETIIAKTIDLIKKRHGIDIEINKLEPNDRATYEMLMEGDNDGVFQLESAGMKALMKRLKPDVFEDLSALVALFRPGPLNSGMVDEFVARKQGLKEITYPHPLLEPTLKKTYGTIVYQEQIMEVFRILADYTLGQADQVRRMMGKKKIDEMQQQKGKFVERSAAHGMSKEDATTLFEQIEKFAEYCFNMSHSVAYGYVAYQTAWLKCHYPQEYLSCLLSSVSNDQEKTQLYIELALKKGIKVLPPDINKSYSEFYPDGNNIRFGLMSIKQVGGAVVSEILAERERNGEFKSIYDFCKRVDAKCSNKKVLEGLIKAGAFSNIEKSRKQLLNNIEYIVATASKENQAKMTGQVSLFGDDTQEELGFNGFHLAGSDEEFDARQIQRFEKEFLGFYVTTHPLASIRDKLPFLMTHKISEINQLPNDKTVTICGLISSVRKIPTKKDPLKFIKFVTVEDLSGKIDTICFPALLAQYDSLLEIEQRVIISGKVNRREGDENSGIIIDTVKTIDNSNIFDIKILNEDVSFEELMWVREFLTANKGADPVTVSINDESGSHKILSGANFWVNSSNDLINKINSKFKDKIQVSLRSLDEPVGALD